jgi:hypothetical protein
MPRPPGSPPSVLLPVAAVTGLLHGAKLQGQKDCDWLQDAGEEMVDEVDALRWTPAGDNAPPSYEDAVQVDHRARLFDSAHCCASQGEGGASPFFLVFFPALAC